MRIGFLNRLKPTSTSFDKPAEPQPPVTPIVLTYPSMKIPRIPPELTDRIIDHLHNDAPTLRSCSRVSKSWLPRSRYYSWHFVELNLKNWATFEHILREDPDIGYLVRALRTTVYFFEEKPNWVDENLPRIARWLPAVEELTLAGNGTYRAVPFHAFPAVRKLSVRECEFTDVNEFITLLHHLPVVEELFSDGVLVGSSASLAKLPKCLSRPKLRKIELHDTRLDPHLFWGWMTGEGMHEHVESIILLPQHKGALIPIGKFIDATGPRLKHFEIAMTALQLQGGYSGAFQSEVTYTAFELRRDLADVIGPFFNLASATGLRTIEFGSPADYASRYGSDDTSFSWISMMLAQTASPVIEEVTLSLSQGDLLGLGTAEWKHTVTTLLSDRFRTLKRVRMRILGPDKSSTDIRRILEMQLKSLEARKVLEFDMPEH
ncbi:hypothetical protein EUX98_g6163 [Antrodiella citrinella]|uniref:F-box domain-containing protein n=1 Tax=Antrodiella citrinella TaxID=2447956 RepID=A0A4S4MRK7_9APHY|nr:hypothetical protein EUX98_g6163 [Antrodiella citrinella]